jgi:hypothetical protein
VPVRDGAVDPAGGERVADDVDIGHASRQLSCE